MVLLLSKKNSKEPSTIETPETPEIEGQKIPKRSPLTKRAVVYGLIVGIIYVFLAIYTSLKTGVTFVAGVILIGYILLSVRNKYNPQENVVISAIAEGSILVGAGVIASLPAIVIFSPRISQRGFDWIFYLKNVNPPWTTLFFSGENWYNSIITPELLITLGLFAGITGLFMLFPLKEQLLKLPWPGLVPTYRTIEGLGDIEMAKNTLLKGIGIGAIYTGIFTVLGVAFKQNLFQLPAASITSRWLSWFNTLKTQWLNYTDPLQQTIYQNLQYPFLWLTHGPLPDFLGISNSPLVGAIGYFVGWKRALIIFAGSIWSIIVWFIWEQGDRLANYGTHIMLPMIYYTSMGVLIAYLSWELVIKSIIKYREEQKKMQELREQLIKAAAEGKIDAEKAAPYLAAEKMSKFAKIKQSINFATANFRENISGRKLLPLIISVVLFAAGATLLFNTSNPISQNMWGVKILDIPWYLTLGASPLLAFSGWWFTTAIGEAGYLINYLTDSLVVPAIILGANFPSIIIFITILSTWQQSAGRYIARVKIGRELKVKDKIITKSMLIGVIFGALASAFIIIQLYSWGGFGTPTFPAPAATITGLFFMSMVELNSSLAWFNRLAGYISGATTGPLMAYQYILQSFSDLVKPWYAQSWFVGGTAANIISIGAITFLLVGFAIGLILAKYEWSPISLAVGLLIPPYISATMFLGGILNYYVYRKHKGKRKADQAKFLKEEMKYQNTLAGLATGDGVTQILWILCTMFLL